MGIPFFLFMKLWNVYDPPFYSNTPCTYKKNYIVSWLLLMLLYSSFCSAFVSSGLHEKLKYVKRARIPSVVRVLDYIGGGVEIQRQSPGIYIFWTGVGDTSHLKNTISTTKLKCLVRLLFGQFIVYFKIHAQLLLLPCGVCVCVGRWYKGVFLMSLVPSLLFFFLSLRVSFWCCFHFRKTLRCL